MKKLNGGFYPPQYTVFLSRKGEGCYVEDVKGRKYLDFASQICSNPLGYNHPAMIEVVKEYSFTAPVKVAGQDFFIEEHVRLLEELMKITPKSINSGFLINSGAEAVENALKICYKFTGRRLGVGFENAFHGRTLGALSFTKSKKLYYEGFPLLDSVTIEFSEQGAERLEKVLSENKAAFVIIEPVQGEGGYNIPTMKMMKTVRRVTKKYKVPLICDEIQSGMGRTGEWWAFQHFKIVPEVMTSAKALQVGAVLANKKMFPESGVISSTWGGGHRIDLAMAVAIIRTIKKEKLLKHNKRMGKVILGMLKELEEQELLINARGLGLMLAFDLPTKKARDEVVKENFKRGLLTLGCGEKSIRVIPPYIITELEAAEGIEIITQSLRKVLKQ